MPKSFRAGMPIGDELLNLWRKKEKDTLYDVAGRGRIHTLRQPLRIPALPIHKPFSYQSGLGIVAHPLTVRWTYAVPQNKQFIIGGADVSVSCTQTTAVVGRINCGIRINSTFSLNLYFVGLTAGERFNLAGLFGTVLTYGDIIEGCTEDTSTTTGVLYQINMNGLEYDL